MDSVAMRILLPDEWKRTWGGVTERELQQRAREAEAPILCSGVALISQLGEVPPALALSRTFGGQSIGTVGPLADTRELNNRRRLFLIDKKFHSQGGLSTAQEEELRQLQADFESYLDTVHPLPTRILNELESLAEQLEA